MFEKHLIATYYSQNFSEDIEVIKFICKKIPISYWNGIFCVLITLCNTIGECE